jgi:hypothetical protein|tara:strand:+ start:21785 stop:22960 length:1176 start_codon:yes stop_codon:yes gene_type:complete
MSERVQPFPFYTISGGAYERGVQYGTLARDRVKKSIEIYGGALDAFGLSAAAYARLVGDFAKKVAEFDEQYLEEMRGIAKGADVDLNDVVLINARTEIVAMARAETGAKDPDELDDGCTGAIILPEATKSGNLIHGQNWDWRSECAETGVVLRVVRGDGPDFLTFVEAGGLARSGFNAAGISITANYLECDRDYTQIGVPLGLIRRKVLEQEHFAIATKVVATTPKSCSNNIMIASKAGFGIDFECAPDEAFPILPDQTGKIVHANHWVSPVALGKIRETGIPFVPESYYRDWRVARLLGEAKDGVDRAALKRALGDDFLTPYSVCRPPRGGGAGNITATVATVIMEPAIGVLEIAPLPALGMEFTSYTISDDVERPGDCGTPMAPKSIED